MTRVQQEDRRKTSDDKAEGESQATQGASKRGGVMKGRRSNIHIIAEILRLGEAKKTEIMYSVNMSHSQLEKYLGFLLEKQLIEINNGSGRKLYRPTKRGARLLEDIDRMAEVLELDIE